MRPVSVPVQHYAHAGLAKRLFDCSAVHVGNIFADGTAMRHAGLPRPRRKFQALRHRLGQHHRLPLRVSRHFANFLVFDVIGAIGVSMAQQYGCAVNIENVWVWQNFGAGLCSKIVADHKITITVHEVNRYILIDHLANCLLDRGVVFIGIVIADPRFKQITEDVQSVRRKHLRFQ